MKLEVKKLYPDAQLPTRAYETDAGYDLYALHETVIRPNTTVKVETGIALQPPTGWYGRISERSSIGSRGIAVRGGVVDEGYTGEIVVCLSNLTWKENYIVKAGDKIAQIVFHQYGNFGIELVEDFEENESDRGNNGFGSSGR